MTKFSIFSKALYSSWCNVPEYNILFDCGEGCATHLGNTLAGVEYIFLSHSHGDHVLGLPSVIGCRNSGRGISRNVDTMDHNKPLTVYYPADNDMHDLISFVRGRNSAWLRYDLEFVPIKAGFELDLGNKRFVRAFNMRHQNNKSTLGYVIYENRTRLKPEYRGKDIPALLKSGVSRDQLNELYRANLFAYCLDSSKIVDVNEISACECAVMDCTFIDESDRTDKTHFTLDEALKVCNDAGVKKMYAAHQSGRYDYNEVVAKFPNVHFVNPYKVNHL